jgi:hypothetical protein
LANEAGDFGSVNTIFGGGPRDQFIQVGQGLRVEPFEHSVNGDAQVGGGFAAAPDSW